MFVDGVDDDDMVDVAAHPGAIITALAVHDRQQAAITVAVGEFDRHQSWALDGARSMKAWLVAFTGRSPRDAARLVRDARCLRQLPVTAAAYGSGQLSGGQLDAALCHLTPTTLPLFAEHETELLPTLFELPVAHVERVMARWQRHADAITDPEPSEPRHGLHLSALASGTRIINGELTPVAGATIEHALRLATVDDPDGVPIRPQSAKQADALVAIAEFFLAHRDHDTGIRHTPHVDIHVDLDTLEHRAPGVSEFGDGTQIPRFELERLLCDSHIGRIITRGGSVILDVGRRRRLVTPDQRRALIQRDHGCRAGNCGMHAWRCDAHHIRTWLNGGETDIDNLILLCSYHHHLIHRHNCDTKLLPDNTFTITLPNNTTLTSRPPP